MEPSGRASTTTLPTWSSVGGIDPAPRRREAGRRDLLLELGRARAARGGSRTSSFVRVAVGCDDGAHAVERDRARRRRAGRTATGWLEYTQPSTSRMSGPGGTYSSPSGLALEVHQGGREQPAGRRCAATALSMAMRSSEPSEQLHELHRGEHQVEPAAEVERAGVRGHACRGRPSTPARAAHASSRNAGSRSTPVTRWPRRASRTDDPARPAAEVEDVARRRLRQLVPQGQVGGVGAALDVVPDRLASFPERRRVAARRQARHAARAGPCRWGGRRASARCFPSSARSKPRSSAGITSSRRWPTPAYFSRSASSSARVPEQTTRAGARRERLEVGVPDPRDVAPVRDAVVEDHPHVELALAVRPASVRNTSFAPGGVLHQQDRQPRGRRGRSAPPGRTRPRRTRGRASPPPASIPSCEAAGGSRGRVVDVVEPGEAQRDARSRPPER